MLPKKNLDQLILSITLNLEIKYIQIYTKKFLQVNTNFFSTVPVP